MLSTCPAAPSSNGQEDESRIHPGTHLLGLETKKQRGSGTLHHEVHGLPLCLSPELRVARTDPRQRPPPAHDGHHTACVTRRKSKMRAAVSGRRGALLDPPLVGTAALRLGPGAPREPSLLQPEQQCRSSALRPLGLSLGQVGSVVGKQGQQQSGLCLPGGMFCTLSNF